MADVYAPSAEVEFGDHAETREDHMLASNALGLPQVLFCIVTGAAPIAAMLFNVPVSVSGGGRSTSRLERADAARLGSAAGAVHGRGGDG